MGKEETLNYFNLLKRYRFSKEKFMEDMLHIPRWVDEADGEEVYVTDSLSAEYDYTTINPEWCVEITEDETEDKWMEEYRERVIDWMNKQVEIHNQSMLYSELHVGRRTFSNIGIDHYIQVQNCLHTIAYAVGAEIVHKENEIPYFFFKGCKFCEVM